MINVKNMKKPNFAICLSGGGFRAAAYHLGTLSYLSHLKIGNDKSFLEAVTIMSTISGGSITGLWYAMNLCKGNDTEQSFQQLYDILLHTDIPQMAVKRFLKNQDTEHSLIRVLADIYDESFFHQETFGTILHHIDDIHLDYYTSNSTDFFKALPFRFQAVKKSRKETPEEHRGMIGNFFYGIPKEVAEHIRLSEILAASSCFPGAFEPFIFPDDFKLFEDAGCKRMLQAADLGPIELMDGGIADNQGLDYIDITQMQMESDALENDKDEIDFIIISDVAHATIKRSKTNKATTRRWWNNRSIRTYFNMILILACLFLIASFILWKTTLHFWSGLSLGLSIILFLVSYLLEHKLLGMLKKALIKLGLEHYEKLFMRIKLLHLWNLAMNRLEPIEKLGGNVFLRRIRRLFYHDIFSDENWRFKRMTSQIYKLQTRGEWINKMEKDELPIWMTASQAIQHDSDIANDVKTSLWFSEEDKSKNIPASLVACGQYTTCWNLLRFVIKLKKSDKELTEAQKSILGCEEQLKEDWERFQMHPQWLFAEKIKGEQRIQDNRTSL